MANCYLITLQGVMRDVTKAPIQQGLDLYYALCPTAKVYILGEGDREKDEWFLASHGLNKHSAYIELDVSKGHTLAEQRLYQITQVRANHGAVDVVYLPDPEQAEEVFEAGNVVMLFMSPKYTHPKFRPDAKHLPTPWKKFTKRVQEQKEHDAAWLDPERIETHD